MKNRQTLYLKSNLLLILFALTHSIYGQELVPNGGFEDYSDLPDNSGQWNRCSFWTNAGGIAIDGFYGDADYFHMDGGGSVQLPGTVLANVSAHSGDAIMGFLGYQAPYMATTDIREYLMVELNESLTIGNSYNISFWITNGSSGLGHIYKCDGIGINFSTSPLNQAGASYIDRAPQLEIEGELFTNEWQEITFDFIADSAYTYLTIGNFYSDTETNISVAVEGPLPFQGAYYFVDDFSLEVNGLNEISENTITDNSLFTLYPNPSIDVVSVKLNSIIESQVEYTLLSIDGKVIQSGAFSNETTLNLESISSGVYLIVIKQDQIYYQQKLIKR